MCIRDSHLAGGTALALYYGHRISVDIDLFSDFSFDTSRILDSLRQDHHLQLYFTAPDTIKGRIGETNIDIIAHKYSLIRAPSELEGISVLSEPDILAMKLNAISISGQRSKDFIDIYFALRDRRYELHEIIDFYKIKYGQEGDMHVIKGLVYFDDVDLADWPVLLRSHELNWKQTKGFIEAEIKKYLSASNDSLSNLSK